MWNKVRQWMKCAWPSAPVRVAVFIDTDGISPQVAEDVMHTVKQHGHVSLLRAYGNQRGRAAITWGRFLSHHKGEAQHHQALTRGKNATDVALSIDAVEILLTRQVEIFVLVVNDTDFVPLVRRLKIESKRVFGFGQRYTPKAFQDECDHFWDVGSLEGIGDPTVAPHSFWKLAPADAQALVTSVLEQFKPLGGPVALNDLVRAIRAAEPGFDPRVYSRKTISDLLRDLPAVELVDVQSVRYARLCNPPNGTG